MRSQEFYIGFAPSWRVAVIQSSLKPGVKFVLLILAEFCSGMGSMIWPGKPMLSELAGVPISKVEGALKTARDLGWLDYDRGYGGGESAYRLALPRDLVGTTGCISFPRSEGTRGVDHHDVPTEILRLRAELAALQDEDVLAALKELGGQITNINVTRETD